MDSIIYIGIGVGMALLAALIATIVWLSKSRKAQVRAEATSDALKIAKELRHEADKVMAEPVADERAWLRRVRDRLGLPDDSGKP